ncbi:hypothetical protein NCCP28_43020 [Niallia sp. NCCP-28]|nr:hypothetical protein NCCP28_43020 [Niallia sp. NCCP-28]
MCQKLDSSYFQTWHTQQGAIDITKKEHSVLVTGYGENYIYFSDPMTVGVKKAPINDFREAWIQVENKQLQLQKVSRTWI